MRNRHRGRHIVIVAALAAAIPLVAGGYVVRAAQTSIPPATLEPGEESPGGGATTERGIDTRDAFSQFSEGIGLAGEADFKVGNAIFRKLWVSAPSSNKASDGLGPLYNARGCQNCHLKDGRGRPPNDGETAASMFLRLSISPETDEQKQALAERRINAVPEPTYGGQLQNIAIQGHAPEGQMRITYADLAVALGDGTIVTLRKPSYAIADLGYGALREGAMLSPRVAPQMIGMGLLEAILEADIRALADPDDKNGDGIRGRTNEVWSTTLNKPTLGRFGWKAGNASVRLQAAEAFAGDMGLSTKLHRSGAGECTAAQTKCREAPDGASDLTDNVEVSDQFLELVTFYSQNLAVPRRRNESDPAVLSGKATFNAIGCASCHHPSFTTGTIENQPHLSNQKIWPYTDMLLHDMGVGLADGRPEGVASGRDWRTPPLWGIGLTELVSGHTQFLHDGRARNLEEAILWHGGEAQRSRDAYAALPKPDRDALLAFVKSL